MLGGHLVHERKVRHRRVHELDRGIHSRLARIRLDTQFSRQWKRFHTLPVRNGAECGPRGQQVVQMRGACTWQTRDDDRRQQVDLANFGMAGQQVVEQQPVFERLQHLRVEVDDSRSPAGRRSPAARRVKPRGAPGSRRIRSRSGPSRPRPWRAARRRPAGTPMPSWPSGRGSGPYRGLNRGTARSSRCTSVGHGIRHGVIMLLSVP